MRDLSPQEHLARFGELEHQALNFRNLWQEIQEYVTPWREPITYSQTAGHKMTDRVFDSTAMNALPISSAAVHSLTAPAGVRWFNLAHTDPMINRMVEAKQGLEKATEAVRAVLNNSNFNAESHEIVMDLLAFGTGALFREIRPPHSPDGWPRARFQALAPGSYVIGENADGMVDTLYRRFRLSAQAIYQRWPDSHGPEVEKLCQEGKNDHQLTIIHGVFPRFEHVDMRNDLSVPPKRLPWGSIYILKEGSVGLPMTGNMADLALPGKGKNCHVLSESGFHEFPYLVPRWFKFSGESYGRSPIMNALPDIRTLNAAVEMRLKAWQLAIAPPIAASDRGVLGDIRLNPFGRIHTKGDPRVALMPLNLGADFNVANFQEEHLRNSIKTALFIDQISSAQSQGLTPKSATEVSINFEMMMRILGPVSTRLHAEFLVPLVVGLFRGLMRHGKVELTGPLASETGMLEVIFEGPLARSTAIQEVDAISRWLQVTLPLAELKPEVLKWVDFGELGRVAADAVGIPGAIMKTDEQVAAEEQAEAQQGAMQNMMGMGTQMADIINKVQPAVTQGAQGGPGI